MRDHYLVFSSTFSQLHLIFSSSCVACLTAMEQGEKVVLVWKIESRVGQGIKKVKRGKYWWLNQEDCSDVRILKAREEDKIESGKWEMCPIVESG